MKRGNIVFNPESPFSYGVVKCAGPKIFVIVWENKTSKRYYTDNTNIKQVFSEWAPDDNDPKMIEQLEAEYLRKKLL